MRRVTVTHPDLAKPVSILEDRVGWLLKRDPRYQVVENTSPLSKLKDASQRTGTESIVGEASVKKGNRGGKKARGANQVS